MILVEAMEGPLEVLALPVVHFVEVNLLHAESCFLEPSELVRTESGLNTSISMSSEEDLSNELNGLPFGDGGLVVGIGLDSGLNWLVDETCEFRNFIESCFIDESPGGGLNESSHEVNGFLVLEFVPAFDAFLFFGTEKDLRKGFTNLDTKVVVVTGVVVINSR